MGEPLWSDEQLHRAAHEVVRTPGWRANAVGRKLFEIRDEYEARIAELEYRLTEQGLSAVYDDGYEHGAAEQAKAQRGEWVPVEEVVVHCVHGAGALWIGKDGNLQATGKHGPTAAVDVTLPEWFAFCRRAQTQPIYDQDGHEVGYVSISPGNRPNA